MLNAHQSLNPGVPTPTGIAFSGRQYPHLDLLGYSNGPLHFRPLRRHLSMPPHRLQLGYDNQRRQMHQPRRLLRINRSAQPLHRPDGYLNPHHNHMEPPYAPSKKNSRMLNPMPRRSVSTQYPPSQPPLTLIKQSHGHRRLAHSYPRKGFLPNWSRKRQNLPNRLLQLRRRSKCRSHHSLCPLHEGNRKQIPPTSPRYIQKWKVELRGRCEWWVAGDLEIALLSQQWEVESVAVWY
jgi:hypothetical protein